MEKTNPIIWRYPEIWRILRGTVHDIAQEISWRMCSKKRCSICGFHHSNFLYNAANTIISGEAVHDPEYVHDTDDRVESKEPTSLCPVPAVALPVRMQPYLFGLSRSCFAFPERSEWHGAPSTSSRRSITNERITASRPTRQKSARTAALFGSFTVGRWPGEG